MLDSIVYANSPKLRSIWFIVVIEFRSDGQEKWMEVFFYSMVVFVRSPWNGMAGWSPCWMMVVLVNFPYRKLLVRCIAIDPYLFHYIVKGPNGMGEVVGQKGIVQGGQECWLDSALLLVIVRNAWVSVGICILKSILNTFLLVSGIYGRVMRIGMFRSEIFN